MMCTTGLDLTQLQCTTMLPGYSSDVDFMVSAVACPADTTADPPGSNLATGNCIKNQGGLMRLHAYAYGVVLHQIGLSIHFIVTTSPTHVTSVNLLFFAGFHGVVTATTAAPYYETDGVNGNSVAACTTQTGCQVDAAICTTGGDLTQLQCTTLLAGYGADAGGMISREWYWCRVKSS